MLLKTTTATLLKALNRVLPAAAGHYAYHAILRNVHVEASLEDKSVKLTCFDLTLWMETQFTAEDVECDTNGKWTYTLPAQLLMETLSKAPSSLLLTLSVDCENNTATLQGNDFHFIFHGLPGDDFPVAAIVEGNEIEVDAKIFRTGISKTLYCTSSDVSKQILTGIHFNSHSTGRLEMWATDGHRLATWASDRAIINRVTTPVEEPAVPKGRGRKKAVAPVELPRLEWTCHWRPLKQLTRFSGDSIYITLSESLICYRIGGVSIVYPLLSGGFPDCPKFIKPRESFERSISIDMARLRPIIDRAWVLATRGEMTVKLEIDASSQELKLDCRAADKSEFSERFAAEITGEEIKLAFNLKYLFQALRSIPEGKAIILISTDLAPVQICPKSSTEVLGYDLSTIIMPIQVKNL